MEYLTTVELSERWNITSRRIGVLCAEGRIEGAIKKGKTSIMFSINACDIYSIAVVGNTVNDCICQRTVTTAELLIPFLECILGTENR